jgi:hypothetical protein
LKLPFFRQFHIYSARKAVFRTELRRTVPDQIESRCCLFGHHISILNMESKAARGAIATSPDFGSRS